MNLPDASHVSGRIYNIKKISSDNNILSINASLIDNLSEIQTTYDMNYPSFEFISNGSQWYILSQPEESPTTVSTDNLIGWWKLDETSDGTAADSSSSGQDGTLNGGLSFSGCTLSGQVGNALDFDGSNDYISTSDNFYDMGSNTNFTLMAWVKADSSGTRSILYKGGSGTSTYGYWFYVNGNFVTFSMNGNSASSAKSSSRNGGVFDGNWHHVAITNNRTGSGHVTYYSDGVSIGVEDFSSETGSLDNGFLLSIGARNTGGLEYDGGIDDVRVYNKVLSTSEISTIYNASK